MCAADVLGARYFHLDDAEVQPRKEAEKKPDPVYAPEESWIGQHESWI